MKERNEVYLEGFVRSCRRAGRITQFDIETVHKRGDEQYALHHDVFCLEPVLLADDIARELEAAAPGEPALIPVAVSGRFGTIPGVDRVPGYPDGHVVLADSDGITRIESVHTKDNNSITFAGRVVSTSYTDSDAVVTIELDGRNVRTRIARKGNESLWRMVSERSLQKGSAVVVSGRLVSRQYMSADGPKKMYIPFIGAISQIRMRKEVSRDMPMPK